MDFVTPYYHLSVNKENKWKRLQQFQCLTFFKTCKSVTQPYSTDNIAMDALNKIVAG